MIIIETRQLTKRFKNVVAVNNLDLKIDKGEVFGIIGPNGAGKTTFLKILATLISPTNGTAFLNGYDVIRQQIEVRKSVGLITSDERSFYWRLSGVENLNFFSALYNVHGDTAKKRIKYLIDLLGLEFPHKRFGEYSSGMKQRLSIARALLHNPEILLMDEPTKSLDNTTASKLRDFVKMHLSIKENKTIVVTTHNLQEAEQICDKICFLKQGKIIDFGTIDELKKRYNVAPSSKLDDVYNVIMEN